MGQAGGLGGWEGGKMLDRKSTLSDMISSVRLGARDISRTCVRALRAQTHPDRPSDHLKKTPISLCLKSTVGFV